MRIEDLDRLIDAVETVTDALGTEIEERYADVADPAALSPKYRAAIQDWHTGRAALARLREWRKNAVEERVDDQWLAGFLACWFAHVDAEEGPDEHAVSDARVPDVVG